MKNIVDAYKAIKEIGKPWVAIRRSKYGLVESQD